MELEKVIDKTNDEFDYINALDSIDIYPSEQFFTQTKDNLKGSPFADYATMAAAWSEDEIKQGLTREQARHYHLNLRTKFKINNNSYKNNKLKTYGTYLHPMVTSAEIEI